jgi:hypothetical protein
VSENLYLPDQEIPDFKTKLEKELESREESEIRHFEKLLEHHQDPSDLQMAIGALLGKGNCHGYSKLESVILSTPDSSWHDDSCSVFIELFIPFNGKPYNAQGDKINLKQFVESLKGKVSEERFKKLEKIVQEI